MVLGRRRRRHLRLRLRETIWPRSGWRRALRYLRHRVQRMPGTPYSIAAGLACGVAVSFTPFIGLHFLLAAALAILVRGNILASALGTAAGNPWTFPAIWSWIYTLGRWFLGEQARGDLPQYLTPGYVLDNPWSVFYPMVLGSIPTAVVVWFIAFWPCYKAVSRYQERRRERRLRALRREMARRAAKKRGAGKEDRSA